MEQRVCPICAGTFVPRQILEKYCSDGCRRKARLRQEAVYRKRRRERRQEEDKRRSENPMKEIVLLDRLAEEAGVSYGKYVERMRKAENR